MIANGEVSFQPLLRFDHDEADWLLFHVNHGLRINNYKKLIIVSADADILVNVIHHFSCLMSSDLKVSEYP